MWSTPTLGTCINFPAVLSFHHAIISPQSTPLNPHSSAGLLVASKLHLGQVFLEFDKCEPLKAVAFTSIKSTENFWQWQDRATVAMVENPSGLALEARAECKGSVKFSRSSQNSTYDGHQMSYPFQESSWSAITSYNMIQ